MPLRRGYGPGTCARARFSLWTRTNGGCKSPEKPYYGNPKSLKRIGDSHAFRAHTVAPDPHHDQAASGAQPHERDHDAPGDAGAEVHAVHARPFCERLCPYCSFNRYPFREEVARPYFANMRKEMLMLKDLGYDFESVQWAAARHHHDRRAVRHHRSGARDVQHRRGVQRDEPEPPDSQLPGQAAGSRAAFERWRAELRQTC